MALFDFILGIPPVISIFLISLLISLIVTIIYKFVTNQKLMKSIKEELNDLRKLSREATKTGDTKKISEIQKKMLHKNMVYMQHSMRTTLITFLPILLIFGWLSAHYAYMPLAPNQSFNLTVSFNGYNGTITASPSNSSLKIIGNTTQKVKNNTVIFEMKASNPGDYKVNFNLNNANDSSNYFNSKIIVSNIQNYESPVQKIDTTPFVKEVKLSNQSLVINLYIIKLSWFWVYLIFSLITNSLVRKLFNVY